MAATTEPFRQTPGRSRCPYFHHAGRLYLEQRSHNAHWLAEGLRKEIARLSELVGALLQMTRAEGDSSTAEGRELQLDRLIADLVEECSVEAVARHCEIAFRPGGEVLMVGDPKLTRRAIENVLRNAVRYSPERTLVDVELEAFSCSCFAPEQVCC